MQIAANGVKIVVNFAKTGANCAKIAANYAKTGATMPALVKCATTAAKYNAITARSKMIVEQSSEAVRASKPQQFGCIAFAALAGCCMPRTVWPESSWAVQPSLLALG
ncbi:MAG: hypothetical protein KBG15_14460 [Kofleriaceae bacterium]|nr:hypothetical protein [Kofleriaceae bacterium]